MRYILEKLKKFLQSQELFESGRLKDIFFTRNRVFSFEKIVLFIINLARKSLQLELYDFTEMIRSGDVTKQAFSKARRKLNPIAFQLLNEKLVSEFYTSNTFKTFKGLRVLLVDGSTIQLPSSPELISFYGMNGSLQCKGLPMAQASILFDALNKITINSIISPYKTSEKNQALDLVDDLVKHNQKIDDLLIFDRGYPSMHLILHLIENAKHFIMRCPSNFIKQVRSIANQEKVDRIINIECAQLSQSTQGILKRKTTLFNEKKIITLRLLSFELKSGEKEILLTTLLDQKYTANDIFNLYRKRWDIEENYKFTKTIASVENFSGKSRITVEQDFYATIFTCNVAWLFMQEVEDEANEEGKKFKHKYKVNKNIGLGILKNKLIKTLLLNESLDDFCDYVKLKMKKSLVPIRAGRSSPRTKSVGRNYAINRRSCM